MTDIGCQPRGPTVLHVDNQGAVAFATDPAAEHKRSKHWDISLKFIQERQREDEITVIFVPGVEQKADFLTKPLRKPQFDASIQMINMSD